MPEAASRGGSAAGGFVSGSETFIDVDHFQLRKYNQNAEGDVFLSQKNQSDGRVITALSDGLGSGIKAGVLATLTATMATTFISFNIPMRRAAEIIMNTLPVCSERGISYATFTLVDIDPASLVKIVEYDNPPYALIRKQELVSLDKENAAFGRKDKSTAPVRESVLQYSSFSAEPGDRLVFFSDGVSQAGMGSATHPFGWTAPKAWDFALTAVRKNPGVSARDLARAVVREASSHDGYKPKDDISCGVVYFRNPRDLLFLTGPPVHPERDKELARIFVSFNGKKIISGGTTAMIISRELGKKITVNLKNFDPKVPPDAEMEGADLVTEGIITMGAVIELLSRRNPLENALANPATRIVEHFLDSDRITFLVGTKINEAHQDPNMPMELEIRRNVIKQIAALLEEKYLKEVRIQYF
jgi:hypothetical protein